MLQIYEYMKKKVKKREYNERKNEKGRKLRKDTHRERLTQKTKENI